MPHMSSAISICHPLVTFRHDAYSTVLMMASLHIPAVPYRAGPVRTIKYAKEMGVGKVPRVSDACETTCVAHRCCGNVTQANRHMMACLTCSHCSMCSLLRGTLQVHNVTMFMFSVPLQMLLLLSTFHPSGGGSAFSKVKVCCHRGWGMC